MGLSGTAQGGRPGSRVPGRLVSALLASVALYYAVWGGEYSAFDLRSLAQRTEEESARLARVRREADSLRLLAERLESDPATIERVARERFGMIRDGEVLYRFVEVDPSAGQPVSRRAP
jgi:cell division protein FtsB